MPQVSTLGRHRRNRFANDVLRALVERLVEHTPALLDERCEGVHRARRERQHLEARHAEVQGVDRAEGRRLVVFQSD